MIREKEELQIGKKIPKSFLCKERTKANQAWMNWGTVQGPDEHIEMLKALSPPCSS